MKVNWRRRLVLLKITLQRGYVWVQLPTLAVIGAGVLKPYFPNWHLWELAAVALTVFMVVGILDNRLRILHEEQSWITEHNPTMMKGLFEKGEKKC